MFTRTNEFRRRPNARTHHGLALGHSLQVNNTEALAAWRPGVQFRASRHRKNATAMIADGELFGRNGAGEAHRSNDAQLAGLRFKSWKIIAPAHNPVHGVRQAAQDDVPRFQHYIMSLITFG